MSIGILGAATEESANKAVKQVLVELGYRRNILQEQYNRINNDDPYKKVHPTLKELEGVYDLAIVNYPSWYEEFVDMLSVSIDETIPEELKEQINTEFESGEGTILQSKKLIDLETQLKELTPAIFDTGKFANGQKFLKYCKKVFEAMTPENKAITQDQDWYKLFESKNTTNSETKVVITSSKISFLAMASVFDNPDYTSCQDLSKHKYTDIYINGIAGNLLDQNSLMCYVTKGNMKKIRSKGNVVTEEHQTMIVRLFLRMLKSDGKYYIVPDRSYPHKTYTASIVALLKELCEDIEDLEVAMFESYNEEQSGSSDELNIDTEDSFIAVYDGEEVILPQPFIWDDGLDGFSERKCGDSSCPNTNANGLYNCHTCPRGGAVTMLEYHDNITNIQSYPEGGTKVKRTKSIRRVSPSWNKKDKEV
jgi:hypothetical protein